MPDRDSQTEAPSERRLQKAREEGDIAISRDLASWATLATAAIALMLQGESLRREIVTLLRTAAGNVDRLAWDELTHRLWPLLSHGLELIAALAVVAVAVGLTQTRGGFWPELIGPRFDRIVSGGPLRRIAKGELFVDMGLGVVKVLAIGAAIWSALSGEFLTLAQLPGAEIGPQLHKVAGLLGSAVQRALLVLAFFAGTDFALAYFRNRSKLKMTKDELKRETKEEDGDPLMRARRRRKHREFAKSHARVAVPRADALIVNPTHIAIAIRYRRGEDRAPRVIAKGKGVLAELMRELAREHSIAIVEDIPLARLLYRRVKIGGEVPAQTYQAVAAVLAFVYRVTGRSRQIASAGARGMSAAVAETSNTESTGEAILALTVLGVMGILIVPLPPVGLDIFLSLSIAIAVVMLLVSLSLTRPSEFSVFPSMLLIVTLFRLGLSVATTRLILLHGGEGPGAAGHLIETFGRFAVAGNLVVGGVIFLILLVVNFAVISKGSNRISEVAARFTLDALPGKQMSIDAELAAGAIDDKQARERRANLEQEAEFFGAMDGASKFVRGDAIAGLAITGINIVGGLITGLLREHLSLSAAAETYTLLTVGDGLVQQLPALLVSTAAGIVVTRAGAGKSLSSQVATQVFAKPQVLMSAAAVLTALALLPGMPIFAFLGLAAGAALLSRRAAKPKAPSAATAPKADARTGDRPIDLIAIEPLELQVGAGLLPLIDLAKGGELPQRITALRKQVAGDLGLILPPVHLRDNLGLEPSQYRLLLRGLELGRGNAMMDRLLALDPRGEMPVIEGLVGKDPAFGLPAKWIKKADRPRAEAMGLTLVDPASVLTTHVSEMVRRNASELLGRQELQELLAIAAKEAPKLVEDTVPGALTPAELLRVCRGLLREGLSIRDLRTILEAMADAAPRNKDAAFLLDQARRRLARQITSRVSDFSGVVHALTLERGTEDTLRANLAQSEGEAILNPDLDTARKLIKVLEARAANLALNGKPTVVITPPDLRRPIFEFASRFVPDLWVVSARELVPGTSIQTAGTLQLANAL